MIESNTAGMTDMFWERISDECERIGLKNDIQKKPVVSDSESEEDDLNFWSFKYGVRKDSIRRLMGNGEGFIGV